MKTRHLLHIALILSAFSLQAFRLSAQRAVQPDLAAPGAAAPAPIPVVTTPATTAATGTTANPDEDIVNMNPFTVSASSDRGYMATETTAGSRVRTSLRDTSASISVFTKDFLDDVGAQSIDEMLTYSTNGEADLDDDTDGGGTLDSRSGAGSTFRIRGLSATVAVDGAESNSPIDLYNVDRAEVSSGANSILFGQGSQGGTISLTSLGANIQRSTLNVTTTLGTWTSPAITGNIFDQVVYKRLSYKYNVVLIPRKWAFKLSGLVQDGGDRSWRKWLTHQDTRLNPTMTIKPFKGTTINIGYEKGRTRDGTYLRWNATDAVTGYLYWLENEPASVAQYSNNGVLKGFGSAYLPPPINIPDSTIPGVWYNMAPIGTVGSGMALTYVDNNQQVYDVRNSARSNPIWHAAGSAIRPNIGQYTLPGSLSSYYYSTLGPGGQVTNNFNSYKFNINQRLGPVSLDLTYTRNQNNSIAYSNGDNQTILYFDPNPTISPANYVSAADNIPNPFAGRPYIQYGIMRYVRGRVNNTVRLQGNYTLNLKQYGRHNLVFMYEHISRDNYNNRQSEVLLDQNNLAYGQVSNPAQYPDASGNGIQRRHYGTVNDFSTYHGADGTVPITDLELGGRTFHSSFVTVSGQNTHVKTSSDGLMLALQNYLFNDDLVTTFGARLDRSTYASEGFSRVGATDPLFLSGAKALNERILNGTWSSRPNTTPYTVSAGAMWHITDRFSSFINYSTNRGTPRDDGRTTLPTGDIPSLTKGRNTEFGFTFDLTGDGMWSIRVTRYDTLQQNDAAIGNADLSGGVSGGDGTGNSALGADSLFNIYDALYFLAVTGQVGSPANFANGAFPAGTGPGKGPMSAAEYAFVPPSPIDSNGNQVYPYGHPPIYTAGTRDTRSQGYELEITANPTKSLSLRWTFSYTQRTRQAILPEIFAFYNNPATGIKHWLDLANPKLNPNPNSPDGQYHVTIPANTPENTGSADIDMPLLDYIRMEIYGGTTGSVNVSGIRNDINQVLFDQTTILGQRPFKITFTTKYAFQQQNWLKGFTIGATIRYASPNLMVNPFLGSKSTKNTFGPAPSDATDLDIDPSLYDGSNSRNVIRGNSLLNYSSFLTYRCKLFGGRSTLRINLNVNNIFNTGLVTPAAITLDNVARRTYLGTPRQYKLSASLDF